MKKKLSKSWRQFSNELKDGRRMSVYDYKLIRKMFDYPPYNEVEVNGETMVQFMKKRVTETLTDKEIKVILKRNPELLELFI